MALSPTELLNNIRNKARLDNEFQAQIAVRLNKPGRLKFQLLAPNAEHLFKSRVQHFIQTLPNNEDPNEKVLAMDCKKINCPVCDAAASFRNSGITVDMINAAYNPKFPYTNVRSFMTQPEHFLVAAKIIEDNADSGDYLPKDAKIGSIQLVQLTKSAFNSLLQSYQDMIEDANEEADNFPPLFGMLDDGEDEINSLVVTVRIQTQPYSYTFSFNSRKLPINRSEIDMEKINIIADDNPAPATEDYVENIIKRITALKNYFVGGSIKSEEVPVTRSTAATTMQSMTNSVNPTIEELIDNDLGDLDLDSL